MPDLQVSHPCMGILAGPIQYHWPKTREIRNLKKPLSWPLNVRIKNQTGYFDMICKYFVSNYQATCKVFKSEYCTTIFVNRNKPVIIHLHKQDSCR